MNDLSVEEFVSVLPEQDCKIKGSVYVAGKQTEVMKMLLSKTDD